MKNINKILKPSITTAICLLVLGIILIIKPDIFIEIIAYIFGFILMVICVNNIIKYIKNKENGIYLGFAILFFIAALFTIFKYQLIVSIIPFVLGIFIILNSSIKIQYLNQLKKNNNPKYKNLLITIIMSIIIGLFLIFNPFTSTLTITRVIGIFITIYSIIDIYENLLVRKELKKLL